MSNFQDTRKPKVYTFFQKLSLGSKLWLPGIILLSISTIALILYFSNRIQEQYEKDLQKQLQTILKTTQGALHLWQKDHQFDQESISKDPELVKIVDEIRENDTRSSKILDLHRNLEDHLDRWIEPSVYKSYDVYIKRQDGSIVSVFQTIRDKQIQQKSPELVLNAFNGTFLKGEPIVIPDSALLNSSGKHHVVFETFAPVFNSKGDVIAVISFLAEPFETFTSITQLGRIGETGETYLVDQSGIMITRSRFTESIDYDGADLNTDRLNLSRTENMDGLFYLINQSMVRNSSVFNVDGYKDYRGIEVVGASLWDEQLKLGVVTEIDKSEAYLSYRLTRGLVWIIIMVILIGMTLITIFREARIYNLSKIYSLEQSAEARKELLAIVSHDLKNPLSSLLMTNELLIKTLPSDLEFSERRRKLLELSKNAAEQMRRLITDLLDTARIDAGKLEIYPEVHSVTDILQNTLDVMEPIARKKSISIIKDIPSTLPPLWIDLNRTIQIFSNILGNAIKFTDQGGMITINAQQKNEHVVFSIQDTGTGIPKEDIEHLFERYWQARKTKKLGTGLGLSICKELITAHGGTIWVQSKPGKGTTFHFTLPLVSKLKGDDAVFSDSGK